MRSVLSFAAGLAAALTVACMASVAGAQGTVVQLPTFNFFGISTTVSVPDSGAGYLGGVSGSASRRVERGFPIVGRGRPFGNRAIARSTQAGGVSVRAQIHDFEAMDEALLGQADALARTARVPSNSVANMSRQANRGAHARSMSSPSRGPVRWQRAGQPQPSVAAIRQAQAAEAAADGNEARKDYERGRELLAAGKTGVAKIYLQRAAKRADPALRAEIAATWRGLVPAEVATHEVRSPGPR